jgi:hypothetical protein
LLQAAARAQLVLLVLSREPSEALALCAFLQSCAVDRWLANQHVFFSQISPQLTYEFGCHMLLHLLAMLKQSHT